MRRLVRGSLPVALCASIALSALGCRASAAEPPVRVLLLGGLNTHEAQHPDADGVGRSSLLLKRMLEETGRFRVDVIDNPAACTPELLAPYAVVVDNWSNYPSAERPWGRAAERALIDFVRSGRGFVVIHATVACFPTWTDYRAMIGAYWEESKAGHGAIHRFPVEAVDRGHPVTHDLPEFEVTDELYHRLTLTPDAHVLCAAYSSPETGGTGRYEPVAVATETGAGRCFAMILGHSAEAMDSDGYRLLLARGTEWAATGEATVAEPFEADTVLAAISRYAAADSRDRLVSVERLVGRCATDPRRSEVLAAKMAAMLTGDATPDAKAFLLEQLSRIGGGEVVPAIAPLIGDERLAFYALQALKRIRDPGAADALRGSLGRLRGAALAGAVYALGQKRDAGSVPALARYVTHSDSAVACAAIDALGWIGGDAATESLRPLLDSAPADRRPLVADALLRCADRMRAWERCADAAAIYERLRSADLPGPVRAAALRGLLATKPDSRVALVGDALRGDDRALFDVALGAVVRADDPVLLDAVAESLPSYTPTVRALILRAMARLSGPELARVEERLRAYGIVVPVTRTVTLTNPGPNLAIGATATSPDGLDKDGEAGGDQAAIDGDPATYWDEVDNQPEYRLVITLPSPHAISALRITGWQQHNYAPRDFAILCDGVSVLEVKDAVYTANRFATMILRTRCTTIELRITGYYGASPAIRELELFDPPGRESTGGAR